MSVTVRGTDILFNDGTTQSTAASAPTTATVLAATAGGTNGGLGTYSIVRSTAAFGNPGTNYSGGVFYNPLTGTWKVMSYSFPAGSYSSGDNNYILYGCLALRIA